MACTDRLKPLSIVAHPDRRVHEPCLLTSDDAHGQVETVLIVPHPNRDAMRMRTEFLGLNSNRTVWRASASAKYITCSQCGTFRIRNTIEIIC